MTRAKNLLERLHDASEHGKPITLSFPDVRLLMTLAGGEIAEVWAEYERWKEIVFSHASFEEKYPLRTDQKSGD